MWEAGADTYVRPCARPGKGKWASPKYDANGAVVHIGVCKKGSYITTGYDSNLVACSMPQLWEYAKVGCVPGSIVVDEVQKALYEAELAARGTLSLSEHAVWEGRVSRLEQGIDTAVFRCSAVPRGEYVTTPCVKFGADIHEAGSDLVTARARTRARRVRGAAVRSGPRLADGVRRARLGRVGWLLRQLVLRQAAQRVLHRPGLRPPARTLRALTIPDFDPYLPLPLPEPEPEPEPEPGSWLDGDSWQDSGSWSEEPPPCADRDDGVCGAVGMVAPAPCGAGCVPVGVVLPEPEPEPEPEPAPEPGPSRSHRPNPSPSQNHRRRGRT